MIWYSGSGWGRAWGRRGPVGAVGALLVSLAAAGSAAAQEAAGAAVTNPPLDVQADPPAPRQSMGIRGFAGFEVNRMAASQSFDAVVGTSDLTGFGAGGEVLRLWNSAFARIGFSRITRDGTRAVVFGDEVSPIGVATTVKIMPLEIAGGWRFGRGGRLVPYAGGGLVRVAYEETTSFDQAGDDTSGTFSGSLLFGGVDVQIAGPLGFGAEFQHRRLADALGAGGASAAFGETDLGGLTFRIWIGVGR